MARSLVDHGRLSGFFITMLLWSFAHPTVTEGQGMLWLKGEEIEVVIKLNCILIADVHDYTTSGFYSCVYLVCLCTQLLTAAFGIIKKFLVNLAGWCKVLVIPSHSGWPIYRCDSRPRELRVTGM